MTTAKTMAADDEDNKVDGDGATGDEDDYGDGRWTTTTMATARQATKSTMMVTARRAMTTTKTTMTTTMTTTTMTEVPNWMARILHPNL